MLGQLCGNLVRRRGELVRCDDGVDPSSGGELVGCDQRPGEGEPPGHGVADLAREPDTRTCSGEQVVADVSVADECRIGGDDDISAQGEFEPTGNGVAVQGGDDRQGAGFEPGDQCGDSPKEGDRATEFGV